MLEIKFISKEPEKDTCVWNGTTLAKVYVKIHRPFHDGEMLADFGWRMNHRAPIPPREIKQRIAALFEIDPDDLTAVYDRNCGCSMCPCSPGYRVRCKDRSKHRLLAERMFTGGNVACVRYEVVEPVDAGIGRN